ncbi:unnamed protein product, partial [Prorocentrum cordatum]
MVMPHDPQGVRHSARSSRATDYLYIRGASCLCQRGGEEAALGARGALGEARCTAPYTRFWVRGVSISTVAGQQPDRTRGGPCVILTPACTSVHDAAPLPTLTIGPGFRQERRLETELRWGSKEREREEEE